MRNGLHQRYLLALASPLVYFHGMISARVLTFRQPDSSDMFDPSLEAREKALVRKQDLRIVPLCAAIYLLCYLDRSNIGKLTGPCS